MFDQPKDEFDDRIALLEEAVSKAQAGFDSDLRLSNDRGNTVKYYERDNATARLPQRRAALESARGKLEACKRDAHAARTLRQAEEAEKRRDRAAVEAEQRRDEEARAAIQRETHKAVEDDANYWFRRLMLQPQLANGAAFLAMAGGILQADDIARAADLAKEPFAWFATGLAVSGIPPFFLWASRLQPQRLKLFERTAMYITLLAGAFFFVGLWDGVMVVRHARQELEQSKPGSPPTLPSVPPATPTQQQPLKKPAPQTPIPSPKNAATSPVENH